MRALLLTLAFLTASSEVLASTADSATDIEAATAAARTALVRLLDAKSCQEGQIGIVEVEHHTKTIAGAIVKLPQDSLEMRKADIALTELILKSAETYNSIGCASSAKSKLELLNFIGSRPEYAVFVERFNNLQSKIGGATDSTPLGGHSSGQAFDPNRKYWIIDRDYRGPERVLAVAQLTESFRDPQSTQIDRAMLIGLRLSPTSKEGRLICIRANTRNGFGGYVGFKWYGVSPTVGVVSLVQKEFEFYCSQAT